MHRRAMPANAIRIWTPRESPLGKVDDVDAIALEWVGSRFRHAAASGDRLTWPIQGFGDRSIS